MGAALLLAYDVALARGVHLPGGDLRTGAFASYVVCVAAAGALLTYLWVPLPTGSRSRERRRSWWSGMLGFLAAIPAAYLVLVVCFQVIRPLLG
ncbi:MAG TPA: hypothetical protein VGQ47_03330 [Candidatus Limnocylindrales bacterium]|nr:hypothetical protein [Candidatus Limnocylindrales bacterium]